MSIYQNGAIKQRKKKSLDTDAGKLQGNTKASSISSEIYANLAHSAEINKSGDRTGQWRECKMNCVKQE